MSVNNTMTRFAVYFRFGQERRWRLHDTFASEGEAWRAALAIRGAHIWVTRLPARTEDPHATAVAGEVVSV